MDTRKRKRDSGEDNPPPKKPRLIRQDAVLGISVFPPVPKVKRQSRSQLMIENVLDELSDISPDKTHYKHYRIVTHDVTDFTQPFVSIGGELNSTREIIKVEPQSEIIKKIYNALLTLNPLTLETVTYTLHKWFATYRGDELVMKTNALVKHWIKHHGHEPGAVIKTKTTHMSIPVIPIDYFIRYGICACRHHVVINALIFDMFLQKNVMIGTKHIHRDWVDGIANGIHSFMIFKTVRNAEERVYFIDTLNFNKPIDLLANREYLSSLFGKETIDPLIERYVKQDDKKEYTFNLGGFKLM